MGHRLPVHDRRVLAHHRLHPRPHRRHHLHPHHQGDSHHHHGDIAHPVHPVGIHPQRVEVAPPVENPLPWTPIRVTYRYTQAIHTPIHLWRTDGQPQPV